MGEKFVKLEPYKLSIVEKETDDALQFYYDEIGCRCIDIIKFPLLPEKYCVVVDDEFLLNGSALNIVASLAYGVSNHGQPICGTVLIGKDEYRDGDLYTVGLTDKEVDEVYAFLLALTF